MAKYTGKLVEATFGSVDIGSLSKSITVSEKADEIDVTTQEDAAVDAKSYLAGPPERECKISALETTTSADSIDTTVDVGDSGTLLIKPQGTGTGKPSLSYAGCVVTEKEVEYPTDGSGPVAVSLSFRLGALTRSTQV